MTQLEQLDHYHPLRDFIELASRFHAKADVIAQVARSRNLTPDHAAIVVEHRWPKPPTTHVQCNQCDYVWAWSVSPRFCPSCVHDSFRNWSPCATVGAQLAADHFLEEMAREMSVSMEELTH